MIGNEPGDEGRWQATLARETRFDGEFVYAVLSTGIYCRPSCPSRKPRREQVAFFPVPEIAEQMGFRACRRCNPRQQPSDDPHISMTRRVCQYISDCSDGIPTLEDLSAHVGASPHHLQKVFKRIVGITPRSYADACRLGDLKDKLREGWTVTDALYESGYGSSSRLYEKATSKLGMTPASYRRRGRGLSIAYAIVECSLGFLLVASTARGVCAVRLGDDEQSLEAALKDEYSAAEIRRDDSGMKEYLEPLLQLVSGKRTGLDMRLDPEIQATAFQGLVWEQLRSIPWGETRTYGEIANAIGQPKAVRAVARACGANPVALATPCHRVVRKDGGMGGYRWGVERKEALLASEQSLTDKP
ncbi:MAG: bifunctional DNA-binding transcriptional regulator/O6-methylguanine-DNA methyltransferase Ada [Chloroflexi bacterium]|nr:bifunctional DNA-binding transcriptional regulator/O6-methylguanine-DNA methyltransferase Ada [Chloroflexota bacterium]